MTICLVALGLGAVLTPLPFDRGVHRYGLAGLLAGALAAAAAWDGQVSRPGGQRSRRCLPFVRGHHLGHRTPAAHARRDRRLETARHETAPNDCHPQAFT